MATFDISFLNPKLKKSGGDYGFLVDRLDVLRSSLESDGKLSPGDYELLQAEAQKIYSHPGLSPAQRSNVEVKIAGYKKDRSVSEIKRNNDIAELNRNTKDDASKIGLLFSNDPQKFLQAQADLLNVKIDRISSSINQMESSGDDPSSHYNELSGALQEYNDTLQALEDTTSYAGDGSQPTSDYVAYLTTNSNGEVTDLKIGRIGAQNGYNETNGIYGGLQVYGKLNRKDQNGNKIFKLGNQTFSASDIVTPNPDGTMKPSVLISSDRQKTVGGGLSISKSGYTNIDLTQVRPQSAIRDGGWIKGDKGFLYQRQPNGNYKKYVNTDASKLGVNENDILSVPRSFEQSILNQVTETIDGSLPPSLPTPSPATITAPQMTPLPQAQQGTLGTGRSNTGGAPTERAPQTSQGIAGRVIGAAKGFLGSLFGK